MHLDAIEWTPERRQAGVVVKLKKVPFKLKLFKLVAPNGDIDWLINELDDHLTAQAAQEANEVRWQVEAFHPELKQLTGSEKCQCRKARSQRNHIACCYQVWISLKVKANTLKKSLYQVRSSCFPTICELNCVTQELRLIQVGSESPNNFKCYSSF